MTEPPKLRKKIIAWLSSLAQETQHLDLPHQIPPQAPHPKLNLSQSKSRALDPVIVYVVSQKELSTSRRIKRVVITGIVNTIAALAVIT